MEELNRNKKKKQTAWRIYEETFKALEKIRVDEGFSSIPALVNNVFARLVRGESVKLNIRSLLRK